MDTVRALAILQNAGFRLAVSGGGFSFYERAIGPFGVQVEYDSLADKLGLRIALGELAPYRDWSLRLETPEQVTAEALNFIQVFESSACVGGD